MATHRDASLDALRGLVIALMTLDHVRGFLSPTGVDPTSLATTTPAFFTMRFVTHLCAPTFVLLMGAAAALRHDRRPQESVRFLVSRGVWLILAEATIVSFAWSWDPTHTYLGVLWALGGSMLLLAPLARAPRPVHLAVAAVVTALAWLVPWTADTPGGPVWFVPHTVHLFGHPARVSYALLPWFAVAALGWGLSRWLVTAPPRHHAAWGAAMLASALALRALQIGDPRPWTTSARGAALTAVDFLHVSKYPPSLVFVLLTVGVALLVLAGPMRGGGPVRRWLAMMGRVPMFFYLAHLPLAHLVGNAWALARYGEPRIPSTEPLSLALILAGWALVLALLTPACRAWGELKRARSWWWLSYV